MRKVFNYIQKRIFLYHEKQNIVDNSVERSENVTIYGSRIHGNVKIHENTKIHKSYITGEITIGRFTSLYGPGIKLFSKHHSITIGNFCSIAPGVVIQEYFHDSERLTTYFINSNFLSTGICETVSKGPIEIGHDVWIGANSIILSGVKLGNGVIVGAGSVVTKDFPDFSIVGGNPARLIKMRFDPEQIEHINKLQWWFWDKDKLKKNHSIFSGKFNLPVV